MGNCCCDPNQHEDEQPKKKEGLKPIMGAGALDEGTATAGTCTEDAGPKKVNIFTFNTRRDKKKKPDTATATEGTVDDGDKVNLGRVQLITTGTAVKARNTPSVRRARRSHQRDESGATPDVRRRECVHETIYKVGGYIMDKNKKRVYIEPGTPYAAPNQKSAATPNQKSAATPVQNQKSSSSISKDSKDAKDDADEESFPDSPH